MSNTIRLGVSLPKEIVKQIDETRGDVPRSKFIQRMAEKMVVTESIEAKRQEITFPASRETVSRALMPDVTQAAPKPTADPNPSSVPRVTLTPSQNSRFYKPSKDGKFVEVSGP